MLEDDKEATLLNEMHTHRARVRNGRLILDDPTDLPEGEVVELVRVDEVRRPRRFGSAAGSIVLADDFDAPLTDFAPYE